MLYTDPALTPRMPARMGKAADLVYKTASDHAMVALRIPVHVAQQIALKGGERAADLHCTLVYLGDVAEINPANLRTLRERLAVIGETEAPLTGRIAGYGRFAPTEDEDVIWCGLDAPDLAELRHRVLQAVTDSGIVPVGDHGFTPHITLAYVEPGEGEDSMPPNADVEIRYMSLTTGDHEVMIPLKGARPITTNQPTLPTETFSDLQAPSVEFSRMLDLEKWSQNQGSLMVRADTLGVGAVVIKKGTDVSIGIENWEGPAALDDLLGAVGSIPHDLIMVGRVAAWDTATKSWVDGADMTAVLLAERIAAPVFFASDLIVLDGDISRQPARERFERLRVVVAPAGGAIVVPLQHEVRADQELDAHVDEVAEWQPNGREASWYCPGVTVVGADSPYAHGVSEHEVRLILSSKPRSVPARKDEGLVGIGSGGGVNQRPVEIIDENIRKPHFPDIRPIAAVKFNPNHEPSGENGGQFASGTGGAGSDPAHAEYLKKIDKNPKVQDARQAIKDTVHTIKVHKVNGTWTPERVALHEKIVKEMLDDDAAVPEGQTPTATFVIGLPASGKSGVLKPTIPNLDKATVLDPDAVKEHLPEYNGKNAAAVHHESAEVAEGPLFDAAMEARHNVVFDLVGKNQKKMTDLAAALKKAGYAIDLRHVTIPPLESAKRAMERFDEMGRFVDPEYIINEVGPRSDATYEALKNSGLMRSWESYDNSGPRGSKPTLREHGGAAGVGISRRGGDGGENSRGLLGEEGSEGISKEGFGGFGTAGTHGILAPQQGMFRKPRRSRNVNKGEIRTDLTLLKVGWTDEAREAAAASRRRNAGLKVAPSNRPGLMPGQRTWEIEHGDVKASLAEWPSGFGDGDEKVLYVNEIHTTGSDKDEDYDAMGVRINKPVHPRETLQVLREIQAIARKEGFAHIEAQVVNNDLGKLLKRLPGVMFHSSFGSSATTDQPHRGLYRIPVPREQEQIAASAFESIEIAKAWSDEARAAALESRRRNSSHGEDGGMSGTPAGEDWQYPNPMGDMADIDPTPNDEPHVRMKPNVWHPTASQNEADRQRNNRGWSPTPRTPEAERLAGNRGWKSKWQDGDSFAVGYGVVGGHTFRTGTLRDGQFVPDKKQPRVNPYEAIFQRKGVLLGLGTVTKSAIDQAQQDRDLYEQQQHDQSAIVGALVAMSESGVPEAEQPMLLAKIGWTDEARAKALETRRRNANAKILNAPQRATPEGERMVNPELTPAGFPKTITPDTYKVRMRDANGETLVAPDGTTYSGTSHANMSKALGHSTGSSIEAGYVRARIDDGLLSMELDHKNPSALANAKAVVSAHGKDSNIFIDDVLPPGGNWGKHGETKTVAFQQPGAVGKALRYLESGGKDVSEAKVWKGAQPPTWVEKEVVFDETKHPRAEDGKWTDGSQATPAPKTPEGLTQPSLPGLGREATGWEPENANDKVRQLYLEEERHTAIGLAQKDWDDLVGEEVTVTGKGGWDGQSDDEKSETQNQWENDNVEEYITEAEKEWQNSSEAQSKKAEQAQENFYDNVSDSDLDEAVRDAMKTDGAFSGSDRARDHLFENMEANRLYQLGEAEDNSEVEKAVAKVMDGYEPEEGEEPFEFDSSSFVSSIRSDYDSRLESVAENIEVEPDDSEKESIHQDAYEKVSEAFQNLSQDELDDMVGGGNSSETFTVEEPKKWLLEKPQFKSGLTPEEHTANLKISRQAEKDYEATRQAAQALVQKRAESLWRERNPVGEGKEDSDYMPDFHVVGDEFWNDWKRDSNDQGTHGMQNALMLELGANNLGRHNLGSEPSGAQRVYAKALWQTTQFVLHKADVREVNAYRAIMVDGNKLDLEPTPTSHAIGGDPGVMSTDTTPARPGTPPKEYREFTTLDLKQAPAQSFTFDPNVANSWGGVGTRVPNPKRIVLRATVPPEAVWSLPVYGKNLQNENEVVMLGTPWKTWEAWDDKAPWFSEHPIKRIRVKTPDNLGKDS